MGNLNMSNTINSQVNDGSNANNRRLQIQYANGYLGNGREWTTCGPDGFPISTTGTSMEAAWNSPAIDNDTVNLYNAAASIGNIIDRHRAQQSFNSGVFNIDGGGYSFVPASENPWVSDNPFGVGGANGTGGINATGGVNGSGNVTNPWDNPFGVGGANGSGGVHSSSNDGELHAPKKDDYSAQFDARLDLIKKYCDKWGKTVDVDAIKDKYANDPQAGVEYCDDILNNQFNQGKLKDIVEAQYKKYIDSHLEQGKNISDDWVKTIIDNGTGELGLSASGVNKKNILDVVGTFMKNDDVKNGKVSLENVFESPEVAEQLVEAMKQKADEYLLNDDIDQSIKDQLLSNIETMRDKYEDFKKEPSIAKRTALIKGFTDAFSAMRTEQARHNDEVAPQYYGLPEDSSITFGNFSKEAREEISAHNNRRKLSTNI